MFFVLSEIPLFIQPITPAIARTFELSAITISSEVSVYSFQSSAVMDSPETACRTIIFPSMTSASNAWSGCPHSIIT